MLLFASVLVTERRREAAVGEPKAKGRTVLDQRVGAQGASAGPASVADASGRRKARQEKTGASSTEDSVAACARMIERKKALWDNPSWQEAIKILSDKKPREWTEADRQKVAEFVAANREMILELRRLAKSGGLAYELDYSKGFAMELPHLAQFRDFARLNSLLHWGRCRMWGQTGAEAELLWRQFVHNLMLLSGIWKPMVPAKTG
jgi:hypothetical protein